MGMQTSSVAHPPPRHNREPAAGPARPDRPPRRRRGQGRRSRRPSAAQRAGRGRHRQRRRGQASRANATYGDRADDRLRRRAGHQGRWSGPELDDFPRVLRAAAGAERRRWPPPPCTGPVGYTDGRPPRGWRSTSRTSRPRPASPPALPGPVVPGPVVPGPVVPGPVGRGQRRRRVHVPRPRPGSSPATCRTNQYYGRHPRSTSSPSARRDEGGSTTRIVAAGLILQLGLPRPAGL